MHGEAIVDYTPKCRSRSCGEHAGAHPTRAGLVDGGTGGSAKDPPVRWGPGESEVSSVMGVSGEQERSPDW